MCTKCGTGSRDLIQGLHSSHKPLFSKLPLHSLNYNSQECRLGNARFEERKKANVVMIVVIRPVNHVSPFNIWFYHSSARITFNLSFLGYFQDLYSIRMVILVTSNRCVRYQWEKHRYISRQRDIIVLYVAEGLLVDTNPFVQTLVKFVFVMTMPYSNQSLDVWAVRYAMLIRSLPHKLLICPPPSTFRLLRLNYHVSSWQTNLKTDVIPIW